MACLCLLGCQQWHHHCKEHCSTLLHTSTNMAKKVAIIGAGASGLAAVKCCLDEGLQPVCYEQDDDIGGLWNYSDDPKPGKGGVYKSCVINTSKEMMAFSDLPVPEHFPPFMPHTYVLQYLRLYADKFDLLKYIQFGMSIEKVTKSHDYSDTGNWDLTVRKTEDDQSADVTMVTVSAVMVCAGHHVFPHLPDFPGLAAFKGWKLHSQDYKKPEPFEDKRVLVIGVGNSAVDIAVDLSRTAKQVHLSTRRGAWVISRMGPLGIPADALANSRCFFSLPRSWLQWMVQLMAEFRFSHANYGLKPTHTAFAAHPTINDELPHRIMVGAVKVRPHVAAFTPTGVHFTDGTYEDIDAVIMATGYNYHYKFVDESVVNIRKNDVGNLYKLVFPSHLEHPTLAMIGLVQAIGSVIPISEMQSRWFTRVIKGLNQLPSKDVMDQEIKKRSSMLRDQYLPTQRHTLQTFWIDYMDCIAEEIGVRPRLSRLLLSDPWLAVRCFFGACVPAQYRLQGPGHWTGARQAIFSSLANNAAATRTRVVKEDRPHTQQSLYSAIVETLLPVVFGFLFMFFLYYCGTLPFCL